jgi:hypothetical protein
VKDEVDQLWAEALDVLYNSMSQPRFVRTLMIFGEAVKCHKQECHAASLVMCRGTLESALFVLQQWGLKERKKMLLLWEGRRGINSLIKWAKGNDILTQQQASKMLEIVDRGGLGAHLEQKLAEEVFEYKKQGCPYQSYRVAVGAEDSFQTIKETVELLGAMTRSGYVRRRLAP